MPLDPPNPDPDRYLLPSTYLFVLDKSATAATKTAKLCLHGLAELVRAYYDFRTCCAVHRRRYQKTIEKLGRNGSGLPMLVASSDQKVYK